MLFGVGGAGSRRVHHDRTSVRPRCQNAVAEMELASALSAGNGNIVTKRINRIRPCGATRVIGLRAYAVAVALLFFGGQAIVRKMVLRLNDAAVTAIAAPAVGCSPIAQQREAPGLAPMSWRHFLNGRWVMPSGIQCWSGMRFAKAHPRRSARGNSFRCSPCSEGSSSPR